MLPSVSCSVTTFCLGTNIPREVKKTLERQEKNKFIHTKSI